MAGPGGRAETALRCATGGNTFGIGDGPYGSWLCSVRSVFSGGGGATLLVRVTKLVRSMAANTPPTATKAASTVIANDRLPDRGGRYTALDPGGHLPLG